MERVMPEANGLPRCSGIVDGSARKYGMKLQRHGIELKRGHLSDPKHLRQLETARSGFCPPVRARSSSACRLDASGTDSTGVEIPHVHLGRRIVFRRSSLVSWIAARERQPANQAADCQDPQ